MPAKKTTVKRTVKKYLTEKTAVIICIVLGVFCLASMLLGGWSIKETKNALKELEKERKEFEKRDKELRAITDKDRIRDSALYEKLLTGNAERQKTSSNIQKQKDERIKEIFSPDFSSNDDSIRAAFSS